MRPKKFKNCREQPNSTYCRFILITRNQVSPGPPINNELLQLVGKLEASLDGPEDPTGNLILEIADVLRQMGKFEQALQLTDTLPQLIPPATQESALLLSRDFTLRARILDQMPGRADEAASASELANHFAVIGEMLTSQQ